MLEAFHYDFMDTTAVVPPAAIPTTSIPHTLAEVTSMAWDHSVAHAFNREIVALIAAAAVEKLGSLGMACNTLLAEDVVLCLFQVIVARWCRQQAGCRRHCQSTDVQVEGVCYSPRPGDSELNGDDYATSAQSHLNRDRIVIVHLLWDVLDAFPDETTFQIVGHGG